MTISNSNNPAVVAADLAQAKVDVCLNEGQSFRLEAGAGAGKTYSLVLALKRIIRDRGATMLQNGQRVACITYTEVARNEISQDIEEHPTILVATIHSFAWSLMAQFQKELRSLVAGDQSRASKVAEAGGIKLQKVEYDLGFFSVTDSAISLAHDDVPKYMAEMLGNEKFRNLVVKQFPVLFIDEYQDTDQMFMAAVTQHFMTSDGGPLIGLFGDHWQTIYSNSYDLTPFPITAIDKGANFRSATPIVEVLNRLRPQLKQAPGRPDLKLGEARFFHANDYPGARQNSSHGKEDLPGADAAAWTDTLLAQLRTEGWDVSPKKTKVLILTHNVLASRLGYASIAKIYTYKDAFTKKMDATIAFFAEAVEPMSRYFSERRYGDMFRLLGRFPTILRLSDKARWQQDMTELLRLREHGTVGEVLAHLRKTERPPLPDRVRRKELEVDALKAEAEVEVDSPVDRQRRLRAVQYVEVTKLVDFIERNTPFSTMHSVKGAEFENVLVLLTGGWNHYNWPKLLEAIGNQTTGENPQAYKRARNLFYVGISRPKVRLAVFATQFLSPSALLGAELLFGKNNVHAMSPPT